MDCFTKLLRFAIRYLSASGERFSKGTSNPCSDDNDTLQPAELGVNLVDATLEVGVGDAIAQVPCVVATDSDHGKTFIWNKNTLKFDFVLIAGGDFSDGGDNGGAARSIGNKDNFTLDILTNDEKRITVLEDGKIGINHITPMHRLSVEGDTKINQTDLGGFNAVLELEQGNSTAPMQKYVGMESFDSSSSISSSSGVMGMKTGAIRIDVNGFTQWVRFYDSAE